MANTLAAALLAELVAERSMTVLQHRTLPFEKMSTDFSNEVLRIPKVTGTGARTNLNVPIAVDGSTTQTNPTNYENGDSTVEGRLVGMNEYSNAFHITNAELNNGHRLNRLVDINLHALMNKINDVAMALVTAANYGTAVVTKAADTIDASDLKTIFAAAEKFGERNLILNGTVFSQFLPTNRESFVPGAGAYGFDSFDLVTKFDAAETDVVGFCADMSAMAIATRLPDNTDEVREVIEMDQALLPNGMTIQVAKWTSVATRETWNSFDVVFGAGVGDESALKIIKDDPVP